MATVEFLFVNIILGLLSAFSPCLFPLLPTYVAMILRTQESRKTVVFSSLFLISGLIVVFLFIGAISNLIGAFLISNYSLFAKIQGGLLILAGGLMIKTPAFIYRITLPDKVENWLYDEDRGKNRPYVFSFILGLLFTIIAAPCASGFFLYVWSTLIGQSFPSQFLLVLAFSLGVGTPFLLISVFLPDISGETVGKMHATTNYISKILGVILIGVGIFLILEVVNPEDLLGGLS